VAVAVPLVAAVAGGLASAGVGSVLAATAIGGTFFATAAASIAGGLVSFGFNAAFGSRPKRPPELPLAQAAQGRTEELISPLAPHRFVIGRVRVAGALVFVHTASSGGRPNALLYQVHVMAAHEVQSINAIELNDEALADPKFSALARAEWKRGTATQSALAMLVDETDGAWTNAHRALGRAIIGTRLTYDEAVFRSGRPIVRAVIEGVNDILDPRTGTRGYTRNPALIVAWYLMHPAGFRVAEDRIDWASVIEAANICDEPVAVAAGGTEPRYRADGTFELVQERGDVLTAMLSAMGGSAATGLDGRWRIRAAAWRPPVTTIDADWLRGPVDLALDRPARDLFNTVRASFIRPESNWQPVDAPVLQDAAALAEDGGDEVAEDLELPFTQSGATAQRLMRIALRRNRAGRRVALRCTLRALTLTPGDVVTVTLDDVGTGTYRITERTVAADAAGIDLVCEEDRPDIYDWTVADERPLTGAQGVTLPDGALIAAPTLTVTAAAAPVPASIATSWSAVADASSYTLSWRAPGATSWTDTTQAGTTATITTGGRASFRVRAVRGDGQVSAWTVAGFPPDLATWQVLPSDAGFDVVATGAATIQVFSSGATSFADATLRASGAPPLSVANGVAALNVWVRPVSAAGVVGAEVGPVAITAGQAGNASGGDNLGQGEGGGGGEGGGSDGGDGGGEGGL
jgi:hypothetical protein